MKEDRQYRQPTTQPASQHEQRDEDQNNPPVPKPAGCSFAPVNIFLILLGGYLGWKTGGPYVLSLAGYFEIPLNEIKPETFIIPILEKTIHVDGTFLSCFFGAGLGAIAGVIVSAIIETILQRCNLLPPDPPPKLKICKPPEINLDDLDIDSLPMIEKEAQLFDRGFREGMRRLRNFALSLLGKQEGFGVQISCSEAFLLRELRREAATPSPLALMVTKDTANRTFVHKILLAPVMGVKEDGTVCWRTESDSTSYWSMTCRIEKRNLIILFYPARWIGLCFYGLSLAALGIPLLFGEPKLLIFFGVIICIAFGILWDQQCYARAVFAQRLQDIEKAYIRSSGMETET